MDQGILYYVLLVVIQAAIIVLGGFAVNYLKSKVGTENLNRYYNIVKMVVMGVEQSFGSGNGADKKAEAIQLIKKITGNKLSDVQISTLIETAVFEMNNLLKQNQIGTS